MDEKSMVAPIAAIETTPLADRAGAYLRLYDDLVERLESPGSGD